MSDPELRKALLGNQLVCVALLAGQLIFALVVAFVHGTDAVEPMVDAELWRTFAIVGGILVFAAIPTAFLVRQSIWRRGTATSHVEVLQAFFTGNIVFQAMLEGASLANITFWLATGEAMPFALFAGVLFGIGTGVLLRTSSPG